ncbi:MAG: ASPIC/UnbV domain-containing protein [Planctomycetes bacterium]|nr:ASPIC/UnbV domain-containing protein [Planctomycetota bacterium]
MSLSPTVEENVSRSNYEMGWVAVHRMLREGKSWSGREEHCSYWNTGDGRFANVSGVTGLDSKDDARAAALVDWDLDGKRDIWIAGRNSPRVRLFLNRTPTTHRSLEVLLRGTECNRDAIGARVELTMSDGRRYLQTLRAGEGYLAQSSKWLHFGLGATGEIARLRVRWPNVGGAAWEVFEGLEASGHFVLSQGTGRAEPRVLGAPSALASAEARTAKPTEKARIWLASRVPLPPLPILTSEGVAGDARDGIPAPSLIVLWATWCPPCVGELGELARRAGELSAAGLSVVALSVDEEPQRKAAFELLERLQWDFHAGFASLPAMESLDALQRSVLDRKRRTPIPTSFLVDHERQLAAVYKGPVEIETLLADVARLRARPQELRERATPFPGVWMSALPAPALLSLELAYVERKLDAAAAEIGRARMVSKERSRASILNEMGKVRADQGKLAEALATFQEAVANEPEFIEARINLAYALHQSGRVAEAIPQYEQVLRFDSRNVTALFNLALARCTLGNLERARQELELLRVIDSKAAAELERQMRKYFNQ